MCDYTLVPANEIKCGDIINYEESWDTYRGKVAGVNPYEYRHFFGLRSKGISILIANTNLTLSPHTRLDDFKVRADTMIWRKN